MLYKKILIIFIINFCFILSDKIGYIGKEANSENDNVFKKFQVFINETEIIYKQYISSPPPDNIISILNDFKSQNIKHIFTAQSIDQLSNVNRILSESSIYLWTTQLQHSDDCYSNIIFTGSYKDYLGRCINMLYL